jgi:hypothetical protein
MPGRTPAEAIKAFLEPFRSALTVLDGYARISKPPGPYRKGGIYTWTLNDADGMSLGHSGTFYAAMTFAVVDSDPARHEPGHQGAYRCSTRGYNYKLATPRSADLWRMHWHPEGKSAVKGPHLHLPPDLGRHLPTARFTFEHAVRWLVEYDAPLRCTAREAKDLLAELEVPHLLYRSWSGSPDGSLIPL